MSIDDGTFISPEGLRRTLRLVRPIEEELGELLAAVEGFEREHGRCSSDRTFEVLNLLHTRDVDALVARAREISFSLPQRFRL